MGGELPGDFHIMGDQDQGDVLFFLEPGQVFHHMLFFLFVLAVGDFVQDQGPGLESQRHRHPQPPFLAEGQAPGILVQIRGQPHGFHCIPHLPVQGFFGHFPVLEPVSHLIIYRIPQQLEVRILEHISHLVRQVRRFVAGNVHPIHQHLAAPGMVQGHEQPTEGGLAAAVVAQKRHCFPVFHPAGDILEHRDASPIGEVYCFCFNHALPPP